MEIIEVIERNPKLLEVLLEVWESSVKVPITFYLKRKFGNIKKYVPQAINETPHLIIIENENQIPVGFMGIVDQHLEMLFISSEERGKGFGKLLIQYGIENYDVNDLAVNEQNPLAQGFYEHMGFKYIKERIVMNREILIPFYICKDRYSSKISQTVDKWYL